MFSELDGEISRSAAWFLHYSGTLYNLHPSRRERGFPIVFLRFAITTTYLASNRTINLSTCSILLHGMIQVCAIFIELWAYFDKRFGSVPFA